MPCGKLESCSTVPTIQFKSKLKMLHILNFLTASSLPFSSIDPIYWSRPRNMPVVAQSHNLWNLLPSTTFQRNEMTTSSSYERNLTWEDEDYYDITEKAVSGIGWPNIGLDWSQVSNSILHSNMSEHIKCLNTFPFYSRLPSITNPFQWPSTFFHTLSDLWWSVFNKVFGFKKTANKHRKARIKSYTVWTEGNLQ